MALDDLVDQIENGTKAGFYFLSLSGALTIPDICGAIASPDGCAKGKRYADWFETWVRPVHHQNDYPSGQFPNHLSDRDRADLHPLTGWACYDFRCKMLHQARLDGIDQDLPYHRVLFLEPNAIHFRSHYDTLNDALCIDVEFFCSEMAQGYRRWKRATAGEGVVQQNLERTVRRFPDGIPPYHRGSPIIG